MLKLKLQYFGHLMWRTDSFEKTLMLGKIEGRRRLRGLKRMRWLDGITNSVDMSLSKLRDGQGGLVCCSPWACKELDTTEWLNWTELLYLIHRLPFLLLHKSYIYSQSFSLLSVLSLWWSPLSYLAVTSLQKTVNLDLWPLNFPEKTHSSFPFGVPQIGIATLNVWNETWHHPSDSFLFLGSLIPQVTTFYFYFPGVLTSELFLTISSIFDYIISALYELS